MSRIVSFGAYTFPNTGYSLINNFGDGVPRTDRLPGLDGGYDAYGDDPAPVEIGRVTWRFRLLAGSPAAMTLLRDQVRRMQSYGRALLTLEVDDGTQRWCYARVHNIQMADTVIAPSTRAQEVVIDWQVSDPRWYSTNADSPQVEACSGAATTFTVVNNGTAAALAKISIDPGTAISASGLTVQRLVDSVAIDEAEYAAALLATDALVIDAQTLTVTKNGSDAYSNDFSANHPAWMRLLPGSNTIKVILGAAETADVTVEWDDCWY
ncbi:MAG: phage tail family protein [Anaerolineae bacterium]|nr:phage tail family protein [Anaerolineae bacterium]NUQ02622.1 phage tail family protein [Anaerolineae bacterium]